MEADDQSPAGSQPVQAGEASSDNLNSNTDLGNVADGNAFSASASMTFPSRSPSGATIPRLELGLSDGLAAVKREIDTTQPHVSDEALLWGGAAASAPSENTDVGHAIEPAADDKSLIRRLAAANTWSLPPMNRTASQSIARMPISQMRVPSDGLQLGQIAAAQSQDTPEGRRTVHDSALPGHVGAMQDNRASAESAAETGMIAEMSGGDSNGARRGTTETVTNIDAQRTPTFAQGASGAAGHSVSNHCAGSCDRVSALNYPCLLYTSPSPRD